MLEAHCVRPSSHRMAKVGRLSMQQPAGGSPLNLTTNPRLDTALQQGWRAWEDAIRAAGTAATTSWLMARADGELERDDLADPVAALLGAEDEEERATVRAELAELLDGIDDAVAETLWEGVLAHGEATDDAETIFDATSHLALIAENTGDPLAAAEYHIAFINWRRQPGHIADPELVQSCFDEIIRLAEIDGAQTAVAEYTFRQANFTRLAETDDEAPTEGDWECDAIPYTSWG
jgi:hypothetical protein